MPAEKPAEKPADVPGGTAGQTFTVDEFLGLARSLDPAQVRLCAVLGRPVAHSLSPVIHHRAARGNPHFRYVRVEAGDTAELRELTSAAPACVGGYSVTMPGKPVALQIADTATARARAVGSANTLTPVRDGRGRPTGRWSAENTDVDGVTTCLNSVLGDAVPERAVVVGNGGTARPAVAALVARGVRHICVAARSERALGLRSLVEGGTGDEGESRTGATFSWVRLDSPELPGVCEDAGVLVSTVPEAAAGEHAGDLALAGAVVDVIYDPYPTRLMSAAGSLGRPVADGLLMLAGQGAEQFRLFTGSTASVSTMYSALREHLRLD